MTTAKLAAFKDYIRRLIDICVSVTNHGEYEYTRVWSDKPYSKDFDTGRKTFATIVIDSVYLNFTLTVYPALTSMYEDKDYEGCGRIILHEISHLLVEPFFEALVDGTSPNQQGAVTDLIERQTQRITNSLHKALPRGWWAPPVSKKK